MTAPEVDHGPPFAFGPYTGKLYVLRQTGRPADRRWDRLRAGAKLRSGEPQGPLLCYSDELREWVPFVPAAALAADLTLARRVLDAAAVATEAAARRGAIEEARELVSDALARLEGLGAPEEDVPA